MQWNLKKSVRHTMRNKKNYSKWKMRKNNLQVKKPKTRYCLYFSWTSLPSSCYLKKNICMVLEFTTIAGNRLWDWRKRSLLVLALLWTYTLYCMAYKAVQKWLSCSHYLIDSIVFSPTVNILLVLKKKIFCCLTNATYKLFLNR